MTTTVRTARMMEALKVRLQSITTAASYPRSVKTVKVAEREVSLDVPANQCPLLELVWGDEVFTPEVGGSLMVEHSFYVRMVDLKARGDQEMAELQACVIRCLTTGAWNATSLGSAVKLPDADGNIALSVLPVKGVADYGMVQANRIWVLECSVKTHRKFWNY